MKIPFVALMLLALSLDAAAQARPARLVVSAARVLDVRTGKVLKDQQLIIEGDRIVRIGAKAEGPLDVVLGPELTVMPGLIDAHVHLTFDPSESGLKWLTVSAPREALRGARGARTTVEAGVTTVRNLGANHFTDIALRDAIEAGDIPGPRIIASGPAIGITGGHCDSNVLPPELNTPARGVADGEDGIRQKVREVIKFGADVIKLCGSGGVLSRGSDPKISQLTKQELSTAVSEAHRLGKRVAVHAHGNEAIRWALEAGADSIEHGSHIDDATIAVLRKRNGVLVPTAYLADWFLENGERVGMPSFAVAKSKEVFPAAKKNVAKAIAAGVRIAAGTDAGVIPHGLNARELAVYVKLGMKPLQAIQTMTLNSAALLGVAEDTGALEVGKWADVIAVEGNPLEDITALEQVRFVMNAGVVFKQAPQGR